MIFIPGFKFHDATIGVTNTTVTDTPPAPANVDQCAFFAGPGTDGQIIDIECSTPVVGRYLAIMIPGQSETLHICAVEVFVEGI